MRTYHKNTERHTPGAQNWAALLTQAVNTPGMMLEAYSAFHDYSVGNQLLALAQCQLRGITPGPIRTFPGWQALGRNVRRGERALVLCRRQPFLVISLSSAGLYQALELITACRP